MDQTLQPLQLMLKRAKVITKKDKPKISNELLIYNIMEFLLISVEQGKNIYRYVDELRDEELYYFRLGGQYITYRVDLSGLEVMRE